MKFEDLKTKAITDLKIDTVDLDTESLNNPKLYAEYLNIHTEAGRELRKLMVDEKKVYRSRWEYYTGKAPSKVYAADPLNVTILKTDLNIYLDTDELLVSIRNKLDDQKRLVSYLEKIMEQIKNRSFQIKNAIEWRRFQAGG